MRLAVLSARPRLYFAALFASGMRCDDLARDRALGHGIVHEYVLSVRRV